MLNPYSPRGLMKPQDPANVKGIPKLMGKRSLFKRLWHSFTERALQSVVYQLGTAGQLWHTADVISVKYFSKVGMKPMTGVYIVSPFADLSTMDIQLARCVELMQRDLSVEPIVASFNTQALELNKFFIDPDGYYVRIDTELTNVCASIKTIASFMDEETDKHTSVARKMNKALLHTPLEDLLLFTKSLLDIQRGDNE